MMKCLPRICLVNKSIFFRRNEPEIDNSKMVIGILYPIYFYLIRVKDSMDTRCFEILSVSFVSSNTFSSSLLMVNSILVRLSLRKRRRQRQCDNVTYIYIFLFLKKRH